jgi:ferritin-like metal-binding protein YciE
MLAFRILPSLVESVEDERLRQGLSEHLHETRAQALRAEKAFRAVGVEPSSNRSGPLEALAEQHDELAGKIVLPSLRDMFHAAAAAATERLELSLYDAVIDLGRAIGVAGEATDLLEESRSEEEHALKTVESERRRLVGDGFPAS